MTSTSASSPSPILSVVVPCFNEEEVIAETHRQLMATLVPPLGEALEIIYVDDGSSDRTREILRRIADSDPRVMVLGLSRNFGHQIAVSAGLDHARGQAVALIDADLQDPPEVLLQMLEQWRAGYQVIYGRRRLREGETAFKVATARAFYRLLNRLSTVPIPLDTGDFRLMDRIVVDAIRAMPEHDRFIRGMVAWTGFRQLALEYDRKRRLAGVSKYPLRKMLAFAIDGILSFSIKPLRLATGMGLVAGVIALVGIVYALVMRLFIGHYVEGWTLLMLAVLFLGGVQLFCLGIIGEYVGRTYNEVKRRPLYLVNERIDARI